VKLLTRAPNLQRRTGLEPSSAAALSRNSGRRPTYLRPHAARSEEGAMDIGKAATALGGNTNLMRAMEDIMRKYADTIQT
jgi:hypothetical protein